MGSGSDIHVFDPRRLLVGETPWSFLLEVAARGIVVYVVLLVAIRFMGKRIAGQLSLSEVAIIVTLGAAIGVPIQAPDRGMVPAVVLLVVAVLFQRGIGFLSFKRRRIELLTQGDLVTLVSDGVMTLKAMQRVGLSRERVFAALRERGVVQLGQLSRVYIETSGAFSVYEAPAPRPGLAIVPNTHPGLRAIDGQRACFGCGTVVRGEAAADACPTCAGRDWGPAVMRASA